MLEIEKNKQQKHKWGNHDKRFASSYLPPSAVSQNETSSVKHDVRCRNAPITRRPVPPLLGSEHCLHLAKLKSALC